MGSLKLAIVIIHVMCKRPPLFCVKGIETETRMIRDDEDKAY
jgi:hypothetical protein